MNAEEAPSSNTSTPIVVTESPNDTIMPENNHFVVPNAVTDRKIEFECSNCSNAISTPAVLQTSIMNAKTSDEINSDVQCTNVQESVPQTSTNIRKLNDLNNSNNQLTSGSMDRLSLNDNISLDERPSFAAGFNVQSPFAQSLNPSTEHFDNKFTDTVKESSEVPTPRDWTQLKLPPIPKNIPKQDVLLLEKLDEIAQVASQFLYLQKLKSENDDIEKRIHRLEQGKADLLQSIPIEKDLTSDPVNEVADDNFRLEEHVIMNVEEAPSSKTSKPVVVTESPNDTIMPENNNFVVHNTVTDRKIEFKCSNCSNAISTQAVLQASIMNAKTSDEINSNVQDSVPQTCTNIRKLNDLNNSNNQLTSGSMDPLSLNDNISLNERPSFAAGFNVQSPFAQSQNRSTEHFDNKFTDTVKESNEIPTLRDWTDLKLPPIPKNIPKQETLVLENLGAFVNITCKCLYLRKLENENDDIVKRIHRLEQEKADLLQAISIENDLASAFPSPAPSVGVIERELPKQGFWKHFKRVDNNLSQELNSDENEIGFALPEPIPSSTRQDFVDVEKKNDPKNDEPNQKKKRDVKNTCKKEAQKRNKKKK